MELRAWSCPMDLSASPPSRPRFSPVFTRGSSCFQGPQSLAGKDPLPSLLCRSQLRQPSSKVCFLDLVGDQGQRFFVGLDCFPFTIEAVSYVSAGCLEEIIFVDFT